MNHLPTTFLLSALLVATPPAASGGQPRRPYEIAIKIQNMDIPAPMGFGERGGAVADLDGDGIQDLAISGWRSEPLVMIVGSSAVGDAPNFKQALLIPSPNTSNVTRGAVVYCPAAPGRPAALVHIVASGRTTVFTGWPLQAQATYLTRFTVGGAVCADVDANGIPELVVAEYTGSAPMMNAYDPMTGARLWSVADAGSNGVLAAQLDGDPALELVSYLSVIDGATRLEEWNYAPGFGWLMAAANLDGDATDEFVAAGPAGPVTAFDSNPYSASWNLPVFSGVGGVALGEIVGGAPPELIVANRQGQLAIHDVSTRQLIRSIPAPAGSSGAFHPHVLDIDGNGAADIAWASGNGSSTADALVLSQGTTGATLAQWLTDPGPFWSTEEFELTPGSERQRIVAGPSESDFGPGSILRHVGTDLDLQSSAQLTQFSVNDLLLAQLDPDVEPEIVLGGMSSSWGRVEVRKAGSQTLIWSLDTTVPAFQNRVVVRVGVADWDGAPPLDVFALTDPRHTGASGGKIHVFRGSDGQLLWESPELGTGFSRIQDFDIVNVDVDASPELLLATGDTCWAIDIATRATDWSFPCAADVVQHYIPETGAPQLMTFSLDGRIEFRQLPGFNVLRSFSTGAGLRAVAAVPGLPTILLAAGDSGVVAIDAQNGEVLTSVPAQLGGGAGIRNRVELVPVDAISATATLGSFTGLFTLSVTDDGLLRDGFENPN